MFARNILRATLRQRAVVGRRFASSGGSSPVPGPIDPLTIVVPVITIGLIYYFKSTVPISTEPFAFEEQSAKIEKIKAQGLTGDALYKALAIAEGASEDEADDIVSEVKEIIEAPPAKSVVDEVLTATVEKLGDEFSLDKYFEAKKAAEAAPEEPEAAEPEAAEEAPAETEAVEPVVIVEEEKSE
ncbi:hypothetical protein BZA70DRAFT_272764 [Myxozyma melibiosi]|uniref:Uncharacterized protein n=1 Tax=Myxozyma melibiosi TaxID=54550 RepID=A0ABR1FE57_9ASCO